MMVQSLGLDDVVDVRLFDNKVSKQVKKMRRDDAKFTKFKKTQRRIDKRARYD